jgi:hypothetical protein
VCECDSFRLEKSLKRDEARSICYLSASLSLCMVYNSPCRTEALTKNVLDQTSKRNPIECFGMARVLSTSSSSSSSAAANNLSDQNEEGIFYRHAIKIKRISQSAARAQRQKGRSLLLAKYVFGSFQTHPTYGRKMRLNVMT